MRRRARERMTKILLVETDPLQAFLRMSVLERRFPDVERVADAAEALCLVEQPGFAQSLGLVVCGPHLSGFGRAEFVTELHARLPQLPILVLGTSVETAADYVADCIEFLPRPTATEEMMVAVGRMLALGELRTA